MTTSTVHAPPFADNERSERVSPHADHFADVGVQHHAARFGMWIFVGTEAMFFGGLILLYCAERAVESLTFEHGIDHSAKIIGTINTFVLLTSSFVVAVGVHLARLGHRKLAALSAFATALFGVAFIVLKLVEYGKHIHEGLLPGALIEPEHGGSAFWTLYWVLTGFHAVHVAVGTSLLLVCTVRFLSKRFWVRSAGTNTLFFHNVTIFWHFVDIVWIFLWPLFYLTGSP